MNLMPNVRAEVKNITTQMRIKNFIHYNVNLLPSIPFSLELRQRRGKEFYHLCTNLYVVYIFLSILRNSKSCKITLKNVEGLLYGNKYF